MAKINQKRKKLRQRRHLVEFNTLRNSVLKEEKPSCQN